MKFFKQLGKDISNGDYIELYLILLVLIALFLLDIFGGVFNINIAGYDIQDILNEITLAALAFLVYARLEDKRQEKVSTTQIKSLKNRIEQLEASNAKIHTAVNSVDTTISHQLAGELDSILNTAYAELGRILEPHVWFPFFESQHTGIVGTLIMDAISSNTYQSIPNVGENKYLLYLQEALQQTNKFRVIIYYTIRDIFEYEGIEDFFRILREKKMPTNDRKWRIFIVPEPLVHNMLDDLANTQLMADYWQTCGLDVRTFWITENTLLNAYTDCKLIKKDYFIFDNDLVLTYDKATSIVSFRRLEQDENGLRIYAHLQEQLDAKTTRPFIEIARPA